MEINSERPEQQELHRDPSSLCSAEREDTTATTTSLNMESTQEEVESPPAEVSAALIPPDDDDDDDMKISPIIATTKPIKNGSGLSELSKQLRLLQAKNQSQRVEISRLERQIRILSDLQGVNVGDLRDALEQACSVEAYGELQHRVAQLEAQLEAATLVQQQKSASSGAQDGGASSKKIADFELRVGELEEREEKQRSEIQGLYSQLMEQQARASRFESLYKEEQAENEGLKMDISERSTQTEQAVQAEKEAMIKRAREAETELQVLNERLALAEQQHESVEVQSTLRNAQFSARFILQEENIRDLEQQLSSLYVAFDLMQEERNEETFERSFLQASLGEADAQVARQVTTMEQEQNNRSATVLDHSNSSGSSRALALLQDSPPPGSPRVNRTKNVRSPSQNLVSPSYSTGLDEPILSGVLQVRSSNMLKKWKNRSAALYSRPEYHLLDIHGEVRRCVLRYVLCLAVSQGFLTSKDL